MVLIDTSVWIDLFSRAPRCRLFPDQMPLIVTCTPVVQEVFQGLPLSQAGHVIKKQFLHLPCLADPLELSLFMEAAEVYAVGRRQGLTIRSSTDCLIAAIAIRHKVPVWNRDRDFETIKSYTALQTIAAEKMPV